MDPRSVRTAEDARRIVESRGLSHVKVGVFDIDGVLRGKYMSRDKFFSSLEGGFGFCDVVLGWDIEDKLVDNLDFTGWHTGYPDAPVRVIPTSCRSLPFEGDMLFFLSEFTDRGEAICPRATLKRAIDKLRSIGFEPFSAFEYEFFAFAETPHSLREKGYRNLTPITPGAFGYSVLRSSVWADFYKTLLDTCIAMDIPIEGLHTETGPGVLEAAITVDGALESADRAAMFKTFSKVVAQKNDILLNFMSKWSEKYPGQGGHIHISLKKVDGGPIFHDPSAEYGMSRTMRHFVGGLQAKMPEVLAMVASTINAYTRLVPGAWAPTNATWGVENRTTALRVIPGSSKSQRVEYRVAAADSNPYLALAAALASGAWGIENEVEPGPVIKGNAYAQAHDPAIALPATLWEAAQRLKASTFARDVFGDAFIDHYAATREWEEREFRKSVTDWELARYFEII